MQCSVVREGWLEKRSEFLSAWRKRWVVLTHNSLVTFANNQVPKTGYRPATSVLLFTRPAEVAIEKPENLQPCTTPLAFPNVPASSHTQFTVACEGQRLTFRTTSREEANAWVQQIQRTSAAVASSPASPSPLPSPPASPMSSVPSSPA